MNRSVRSYNFYQNCSSDQFQDNGRYFLIINLIVLIIKLMLTSSKSKNHLAYVRSGKAISKPKITNNTNLDTTQEYCKHPARNSTGNIYDSIIGQIESDQQDYIKSLISRNQKESNKQIRIKNKNQQKQFKQCVQASSKKNIHERTKSHAEIQMLAKNNQKNDKAQFNDMINDTKLCTRGKQFNQEQICRQRQQRDTHKKICSPSSSSTLNNNFFSCQISPKNQKHIQNMNLSLSKKQFCKFQNKFNQQKDGSLIKSIDSYLQALSIQPQIQQKNEVSPFNFAQTTTNILEETNKFNDTLAFGKDQKLILLKKLQKQKRKVNQMKLAIKFRQDMFNKQYEKTQKKQKKMKNQLLQMLNQIKILNQQINKEKYQKRKLQKAVHHFEESIQRMKPERKTIATKHKMNFNNTSKYQMNLQATENQDQPEYKQTQQNIAQEWENYRQSKMNRSSQNKFLKDKSMAVINNKDRLSNSKNKTINMMRSSNPIRQDYDMMMSKMKSPKNISNKNNVQYFKSRFYRISSDQDCQPQEVSSFENNMKNRFQENSSSDYEEE